VSPGPGRADSRRLRLFVALDLPAATRGALADWRDALVADEPDVRRVAAEQLHVTLAFLGWRAEADVERIAAMSLGAAAGQPVPRLVPGAVRAVPPRDPRLVALELTDADGSAAALQEAVASALREARLYRPERRPFWPHVTVARVRKRGRLGPLPDLPAPATAFEAGPVTLYRSILRPEGALYEPLARGPVGDG
jgi:2'-5' RNA ligase